MKDEEMAKLFADSHTHYEVTKRENGTDCAKKVSDITIEQAFLAGLKARLQWHDLRENPNDLPKRDERFFTNISVPVLTQTSGFAFYQFDDKKWYFQGKVIDVIAWCEIPTFDKE